MPTTKIDNSIMYGNVFRRWRATNAKSGKLIRNNNRVSFRRPRGFVGIFFKPPPSKPKFNDIVANRPTIMVKSFNLFQRVLWKYYVFRTEVGIHGRGGCGISSDFKISSIPPLLPGKKFKKNSEMSCTLVIIIKWNEQNK